MVTEDQEEDKYPEEEEEYLKKYIYGLNIAQSGPNFAFFGDLHAPGS